MVRQTGTLTASLDEANEGQTVYFTLDTANVAAGTQYVYTLSGVSATDVLGGSLSGTITVGTSGKVIVPITLREDATTEGAETLTFSVAGQSASISVNDTSLTPPPASQTIVLNNEPEAKTGGAGDDIIRGTDKTLVLDKLDGGLGNDTLIYNDTTGGVNLNTLGLEMVGVETVEARSVGAIAANTTGLTGVTALNATFGGATTLAAAATTDVTVNTGVTGTVTIDGGKNVSVTHAAAGADITIGATTVNAGTVSVTSTEMGAQSIAVDGGTSVTIVASGSSGGADTIIVGNGGAATDLPSGAVSVTSAHTGVAATDITLNAITVNGGSTVTVTQTADTSKAATDTTGATLTQGNVTVVAGTATTSVTVTQATKTTEVVNVAASASVTETASVQFSALTAGQTLIMAGLTFTASVAMTAAEAAAAFANLTNGTLPAAGDSQSGGPASKGTYSGVFTGWTSGSVSTDTVVFTSTTAGVNVVNLANTGTGTATVTTTSGDAAGVAEVQTLDFTGRTVNINGNITVGGVTVAVLATDTDQDIAGKVVTALNAEAGTAIGDATAANAAGTTPVVTITYAASWGNVTQATAASGTSTLSGAVTAATTTAGGAVAAKTGVLGVNTGLVLIDDNTTAASIKTISLDGYKTASRIGTTTDTTALSSLSLKSADSGSTLTVDDTAATLALTVQSMGSSTTDAVVTFTNAPTTLNVTSTGANYVNLTAAATETLNVSGTGLLDIDATDLAGLLAVTVTGSAGVKLNAGVSNTLTSIDASGTTGAVTTSIDGAVATYSGSSGVDTVTLATSTALTKSIDLGAGDDTLTLVNLTTGSTATLSGGAGTADTLSMTTATAAALDDAAQTFYTGFERLTINNADASADINLANLGFTNYVTTTGSTGTLTLSNLANNGTVVLTTAPTTGYTVGIKDAATGTADVLNATLSNASTTAFGVLTAADVETINLTSTDSDTTVSAVHTLTLTADKATSVTVKGNAGLTLTMAGSLAVTSIDGTAMTAALTVTSLNTTSATTVKGGSGNDVLQAATGTTADVLIGGAGADKLTTNRGLATLTGGAGNDLFKIGVASLSSASYSTITDFVAGDLIEFTGADSFNSVAIVLADTAVFQDYANAAVNAVGSNDLAWFQYSGNTYIVMDEGPTDSTSFINGEDFIVRLTGLVDLTNASFNSTYDTIAL